MNGDSEIGRIAFIGDLKSVFVKRDYEILKKHYSVEVVQPPHSKEEWIKYPGKVKNVVKRSDVVFGWFAGWHTAFGVHYARGFNKKSIIVSGGYDAVSIPEIKYGAFSNLKEKIPAKYVFKNADIILAVSNYLKNAIINNAGISGEKIVVVPTGYDSNFWISRGEKENIVLTVAGAKNLMRVKVKGLDTFVKSAKYLPNVKFVVIGVEDKARKYLEGIKTKNVKLIGYVPNNRLLHYYQRSKVYAQLSISEGLPNTLCEAMLCECIPVGTRRGGIPEVIGDIGFYVPYGNPSATAKSIKKALNSPEDFGKKARYRIMRLFSGERREWGLVKVIDCLL